MIKISAENGLKKVILANIVTLVVAAASLIWNWSAMSGQIERNRQDIIRVRESQTRITREHSRVFSRITDLESQADALQVDVTRLEDFHFNTPPDNGDPSRSSSSPASGSWPARVEDLLRSEESVGEEQ